ncbi:MAG: hypothetical protein R2854_13585 [Caldilineaceae bacterium]
MADEPQVVETAGGTQEIPSRVLPDGEYTWTIEATDDDGVTETARAARS